MLDIPPVTLYTVTTMKTGYYLVNTVTRKIVEGPKDWAKEAYGERLKYEDRRELSVYRIREDGTGFPVDKYGCQHFHLNVIQF